jgi:hypothetical protein
MSDVICTSCSSAEAQLGLVLEEFATSHKRRATESLLEANKTTYAHSGHCCGLNSALNVGHPLLENPLMNAYAFFGGAHAHETSYTFIAK